MFQRIEEITERPADNFLRDRACKLFLKQWNQDYHSASYTNVEELIVQLKAVDELRLNKNVVTMLCCHKEFKALYISDNITNVSGYKKAAIQNLNVYTLFNGIYWKQLIAPLKVHQWGNDFIKRVPTSFLKENPKNYFCGLKLKAKDGSYKKCFFNITRLAFDEYNQPTLSIILIEDVSALYAGDFYWIRFLRGHKNEYTQLYTSNKGKHKFKDLISLREKEILQLISQQYSSKEIANHLHISYNTVEQHRKNMIARSGARDTTALLQLCKMADVF